MGRTEPSESEQSLTGPQKAREWYVTQVHVPQGVKTRFIKPHVTVHSSIFQQPTIIIINNNNGKPLLSTGA